MATAVPRRRVNHNDVSAISGPNIAELPSKPISTPCASARVQMFDAIAANGNPSPRLTAPISSGTLMPKRSARRPMSRPPKPKPTRVNMYGSDASAARNAEFRLYRRQDDSHDVQAGTTDRADQQGNAETRPRIG